MIAQRDKYRPIDLNGYDRHQNWNLPTRRILSIRVILEAGQGRSGAKRARSAASLLYVHGGGMATPRLTLQYGPISGMIRVRRAPAQTLPPNITEGATGAVEDLLHLPIEAWHSVFFTYGQVNREGAWITNYDDVSLTKERLLNNQGADRDHPFRRAW